MAKLSLSALLTRLRPGLMARIVLALVLVGLVPLLVVTAIQSNVEDSMGEQVLRTHAIAARSTAERVASFLESRTGLARAAAANPVLSQGLGGEELLAGILQSQPEVAAVALYGADGTEQLRAQRRSHAEDMENVLLLEPTGGLMVVPGEDDAWLRLDLPYGEDGSLRLVTSSRGLADVLRPVEIGDQAVLVIASAARTLVLGNVDSLEALPSTIVDQALRGRVPGVTGRSDEVIGAWAPVPDAPWTVISVQPREVAEAVALRMRRGSQLALGGALLLTGLLTGVAYISVVRPVRSMVRDQRELAGLAPAENAGSEIAQLQESFAVLSRRMRDQQALGKVFLDRYQVIDLLGEGGMGSVFRGWDPKLQRTVALKTVRLSRDEAAPERRERVVKLLHEAVATARINHPNVVAVFDVVEQEDLGFIAMELVEGITLETLLARNHTLPPAQVVTLALAVAKGLGAAHEEDVIHQDVKPGNILLSYKGGIKVVDFGIARLLSTASESSGKIFGTPGYLPPEALQGKGYGKSGDLFALGVIMYQCLLGRRPFSGATLRQVLIHTLNQEPVPPRALDAEIPAELEELILDLLHKDPTERIGTSDLAVARLEEMAAEPLQIEPTPWTDFEEPSEEHEKNRSRLVSTLP